MFTDDGCPVQEAERLIYREKMRILEEQALAALAGCPGLAKARLWQPSPVIQIVALDGVHLGRIRCEHAPTGACLWFAAPPLPRNPTGPYDSAWAAAHALAAQQPINTKDRVP